MKYLGLFPDVPDLQGCSDGGCVFRPPTGMHTNGGCACMKRGADPLRLQLNLQRISRHMESMRAKRDALAKENAALRALLAECRPSMVEHRKRVEQDLTNAAYFPGRYPETLKALNTERDICDALLVRIDAALGDKP